MCVLFCSLSLNRSLATRPCVSGFGQISFSVCWLVLALAPNLSHCQLLSTTPILALLARERKPRKLEQSNSSQIYFFLPSCSEAKAGRRRRRLCCSYMLLLLFVRLIVNSAQAAASPITTITSFFSSSNSLLLLHLNNK